MVLRELFCLPSEGSRDLSMRHFAIGRGYIFLENVLFWKKPALIILIILNMVLSARSDTVHLYAAGSLRSALTDIAKAYETARSNKIEAKYGPSGLLKNEIATGAKADVFASANMEHPQALHDEKKSGPVVRFVRNKLCALVT